MASKRSKWKKIEKTLKFITISKTSVKDSLQPPANVTKLAKSKWTLLKNTLSVVHYLLRTLIKDLKLKSAGDFVRIDTSEKESKGSSHR